MASYLALALSSSSAHEVFELGYRTRAASTEVFKGATMVETVLEEVDDLLVGDVDYCSAFVKESRMYLPRVSPCFHSSI
jgi:hypothetical protein